MGHYLGVATSWPDDARCWGVGFQNDGMIGMIGMGSSTSSSDSLLNILLIPEKS